MKTTFKAGIVAVLAIGTLLMSAKASALSSYACESLFLAPAPLGAGFEVDSVERNAWVGAQNRKSLEYFGDRESAPWLEGYFRDIFENTKNPNANTFSRFKSKDKSFDIALVNRGLGKPTELIYTKGSASRVLYTSYNTRRNGSFYASKFFVSPNELYAVVPEAHAGSLDYFNLRVIEIATGREVAQVPASRNIDGFGWLSPQAFAFRVLDGIGTKWMSFQIGEAVAKDFSNMTSVENSTPGRTYVYINATGGRHLVKKMGAKDWTQIDAEIEDFVGNVGKEMIVKSPTDDGQGEIRAVTFVDGVAQKATRVVLPAGSGIIRNVWAGFDRIAIYANQGKSRELKIIDGQGNVLNHYAMPEGAAVARVDFADATNLNITLTSPIVASKVLKMDLAKGLWEMSPDIAMMTDVDGTVYETEYVESLSADGVKVPMRLIYKKGTAKNSDTPTVMMAYGGFGDPGNFFPSYNPAAKAALQNGAIIATPALRGGGEFGKAWREDGRLKKKQNTFNDFISSAEYLVKNGYTSPKRIAAMGWSNGGLLMGAIVTQRPDLFRVVVVGNGVLDMFNKEHLDATMGLGWSSEYGDSRDATMKAVIAKYSPVDNARSAQYPIVLVANGHDDSRVNSAHSFKFTQALQAAQQGANPILLASIKNSGHWMTARPVQNVIAWKGDVMIWSTIFDGIGLSTPAATIPSPRFPKKTTQP